MPVFSSFLKSTLKILTFKTRATPLAKCGKVITAMSVKELWPLWIRDYKKLRAWTDKQAFRRRLSLGEKYIFPIIGSIKPNQITTDDVVDCLKLSIANTTQTHWKVLVSLSQFLRWCNAKHLYDSDKKLPTDLELVEPYLGMQLHKEGGHHPAIDWRDVPQFVSLLVQETSISSKALLFVILTVSRFQSVGNAQWDEINLTQSEWHIPATHMKGKQGHNRPHDVPLSNQALDLLHSLRNFPKSNGSGLIFTASGRQLSSTALRKVIRKMDKLAINKGLPGFRDSSQRNRIAVTHGFRAAFTTWAQETGADMTVVEYCLAHRDSADKHNGAYRRGRLIHQRRKLLQLWANYCFPAKATDRW